MFAKSLVTKSTTDIKAIAKSRGCPFKLLKLSPERVLIMGRRHDVFRLFIETQDSGEYKNVGWIVDDAMEDCMICADSFSLFVRRHHCRSCGNLVCSNCCSPVKLKIQELAVDEPQLVCRQCYWDQESTSVLDSLARADTRGSDESRITRSSSIQKDSRKSTAELIKTSTSAPTGPFTPKASFVLKCRLENTGEKLFVNVCHHSGIPEAAKAILCNWRTCENKSSDMCYVVDMVFSSIVLKGEIKNQESLIAEIKKRVQNERSIVLSAESSIPKISFNYKDTPIREVILNPISSEAVKATTPSVSKPYIAISGSISGSFLFDSRVNLASLSSVIPEFKDQHKLSGDVHILLPDKNWSLSSIEIVETNFRVLKKSKRICDYIIHEESICTLPRETSPTTFGIKLFVSDTSGSSTASTDLVLLPVLLSVETQEVCTEVLRFIREKIRFASLTSSTALSVGTAAPSRYTGYLSKQSSFMKSWNRRYFVLEGGYLKYYDKKDSSTGEGASSERNEKGSVQISDGLTISYPYDNSDILICLRRKKESYMMLLCSTTKEEAVEWVNNINQHLKYYF